MGVCLRFLNNLCAANDRIGCHCWLAQQCLLRWRRPCAVILIGIVYGIAPPAQAVDYLAGIDVYNGDGNVNWTTVKNSGVVFAFAKATEGVNFVDARFTTNMQNAKAAGVYIGPYHFCRVDSKNGVPFTSYDGLPFPPESDPYLDAVSEAEDFIDAIKPFYLTGRHLPPVADVEGLPDFSTVALERAFISNWVQIFSDTIYNSLGIRPIIYASKSSANTYYTNSVAAAHKLWIAWWKGTGTTSPPLVSDTPQWSRWQFWQYAATGSVPGVPATNVDHNVFEGTVADLEKLLLGKDNSIPGDYNRDGRVDTSDYVLWRNTMGQKVPLYTAADGNGNATIDTADFSIWKANFGKSAGAGADLSVAAPEPASAVLLAIIAAFYAASSRFFLNRRQ